MGVSSRFTGANNLDCGRDDGKRFVVRAEEKLAAFVKLEAATQADQPIA